MHSVWRCTGGGALHQAILSLDGALPWCRDSGVHPTNVGPKGLQRRHTCCRPLSPLCHTGPSHCPCAAAKPPLQPPDKTKAPLEGEVLLHWVPCHRGSRAHQASLLFQITSAAETEAVTSQKLVKGHAYSVTGAEEVGVLPQSGKTQRALCVAWCKFVFIVDGFSSLTCSAKSGFESFLKRY